MMLRTPLMLRQCLRLPAHQLAAHDTQSQTPTAHLARVTVALHITLAVSLLRARVQAVATEALASVLGAGDAVALGRTVGRAVRSCDLLVVVGERDAGKRPGCQVVGVAAGGRPAGGQRGG